MDLRTTSRAAAAALDLMDRDYLPVPIPHQEKAPKVKGWQKLRPTREQIPALFDRDPTNIGVLLGEPSGGLVDIDLDCPEAMAVAAELLPKTDSVFGRPGKPRSHYLYRATGKLPATKKHTDTENAMLVELRSTGTQTVFPPSVHPSGEKIAWHTDGEPANVDGILLLAAVGRVAAAALLARHWNDGSRHDLALVVGGVLVRSGMERADAETFMTAVCEAAGDDDVQDRLRAVESSSDRFANGDSIAGLPKLRDLMGENVVKRVADWLGLKRHRAADGASQATRAIGGERELWRTPDDRAFATIRVNGHSEYWPIRSKQIQHYLQARAIAETGKPLSQGKLDEVASLLEGYALQGPEHEAHTRTAGADGMVYIDLCNDQWEAVQVDAAGWRAVQNPPVRFFRKAGAQALPHPISGGTIDQLRPFVNVASTDDFRLFTALLLAAWAPDRPYPIGILNGEQGTSKSTLALLHRRLTDPNVTPTRALPKSEHDLFISARNGLVLSYDNVSVIPAGLSDAFCRLATGGGFSTRALYTDGDGVLFNFRRPVLLNGIPSLAERPDLVDRSIVLTLPVLLPHMRRTEREFWAAFDAAHPTIFGALLDGVSSAVRNLASTRLEQLPRMADFVQWMVAAEEGLGWKPGTFLAAYEKNRTEAMVDAAALDPLANCFLALVAKLTQFRLTATELMHRLNEVADQQTKNSRPRWLVHPQVLTRMLRRLAPALRAMGVILVMDEERDENNVKLIEVKAEDDDPNNW